MKYQLVIQFAVSSIEDYDAIIAVEDLLSQKLGSAGRVDGHDAGSGEMNIFIFTDDPKLCFQAIQQILGARDFEREMKVAFREVSKDDYTILHPPGLTEFAIA
jgi:hypothetical protein